MPGWLGPKAKVDGTLTLSQIGAADWEADFQGNLIDVDLSTLVGGRFPRHHLSGYGSRRPAIGPLG